MSTLPILHKLEKFLDQDLKREKLTPNTLAKKNKLLEKLKKAIQAEEESVKLDELLTNQRNITKKANGISHNNNKKHVPLPELPTLNEDYNGGESTYIDLNEPFSSPVISTASPLAYKQQISIPASSNGDGSGSGYESYESEEETRSKPQKELEAYYSSDDCDVYSFVFMENKTFMGGKKWSKRVGIVKDAHFKCFKKVGDSQSVLDMPLRAYTVNLSTKEGTNDIIISLEAAGNQGGKEAQGYSSRFYVEHAYSDPWSRVLREKCNSVVTVGSLPAPPVSVRPMIRTGSLSGMTSDNCSSETKSPNHEISPASSSNSLNNIGKGLKSAAAGMFKGNKLRKKITVIEQLGADLVDSLGVCLDGKWTKKLCVIKSNELCVYGKEEEPEKVISLHGCDLKPYFDDPEIKFGFKITKDKKELLFLEASSSQEMGRWIGLLVAETGLADMPETPQDEENIYVEPCEYQSMMDTARKVFHETIKLKKGGGKSGLKSPQSHPQPIIEEEECEYLDIAETMPPPKNGRSHTTPKHPPPPDPLLKPRAKSEPVNILPNPPKRRPKHKKEPLKIDVSMTSSKSPSSSSGGSGTSGAEPGTPSSTFLFNQTNLKKDKKEKRREVKSEFIVVDLPKKSGSEMAPERSKDDDARIAELTKMIAQINIKKEQLTSYLEQAQTQLEKSSVRKALKQTNDELRKLGAEKKVAELRKKQLDNNGNKRPMTPQSRPRSAIDSVSSPSAKGNVMSRAKMFENL